eukprot:scaffold395164_cov132-Cyclotella_meneghiniana.AAC.4
MSSAQQFAHPSEKPCVPPIMGPCKHSLNPLKPPLNNDFIAHFCDCTANVFLVLYSSSRSIHTVHE